MNETGGLLLERRGHFDFGDGEEIRQAENRGGLCHIGEFLERSPDVSKEHVFRSDPRPNQKLMSLTVVL